MLYASFVLLSVAVPLGGIMLANKLQRLAIIHALAGGAGLILLILAWRHAQLQGPFALDALVLLAAALCGGLLIAVLKRPAHALLLTLHAAAGGLAYLLLAGFVFGR